MRSPIVLDQALTLPALALILLFPQLQLPARYSWQTSAGMQTLEDMQLSEPEKRSLLASVVTTDGSDADLISCDKHGGCLQESDLRAQHIDLGEGSQNGLVVLGHYKPGDFVLCGPTGNCETVLFRKAGAEWKPIIGKPPDRTIELSDTRCSNARTCEPAPWAAAFALLESRHEGLRDIALVEVYRGQGLSYTVWEFNGTRYVLAPCHALQGVPQKPLPPKCK
jgi:hypothetical protein